jgi:hypothetical protein
VSREEAVEDAVGDRASNAQGNDLEHFHLAHSTDARQTAKGRRPVSGLSARKDALH